METDPRKCLHMGQTSIFSIFQKYQQICLKSLTINYLAGFGGPGLLKTDPAYIYHHHWYGWIWFSMSSDDLQWFSMIFQCVC